MSAPRTAMMRILFVDDEPTVLDGLRRLLLPQRSRWETVFAGGGDAALRTLEACPCDVVVTALRMAGMDGIQFLERVRDRFPGVVRIVMSGDEERGSIPQASAVAHQFVPKGCDAAILMQTIERTTALAGAFRDKTVRRVVGAVGELPCLPRTAATVMEALDDPNVSFARVGQIVEHDVAISAKVMQLTNSALFARSQAVTSIPHAISVLGADVLKQLVIGAEVFRAFRPERNIAGFGPDQVQSHSHLAAAIAARLPLPNTAVPLAAIAALLHDAGKLVLASRVPMECERIRRLTIGGQMTFLQAEQQVLGASHAQIGACLLALWGLPGQIVSAVERHHCPGVVPGDIPGFHVPAAVYFANLLAHQCERGSLEKPYPAWPPTDLEYLRAVGMSEETDHWREMAQSVEVL